MIQNLIFGFLFLKNITSGMQLYKKSIARNLFIFKTPTKMTNDFFNNYIHVFFISNTL